MMVHGRTARRCTREKLRSPGRPSAWCRENYLQFWQAIALGRSSEEAAVLQCCFTCHAWMVISRVWTSRMGRRWQAMALKLSVEQSRDR